MSSSKPNPMLHLLSSQRRLFQYQHPKCYTKLSSDSFGLHQDQHANNWSLEKQSILCLLDGTCYPILLVVRLEPTYMLICLDHSLMDREVVLNSFCYFQWPNWKQLASAIHKAICWGADQGNPCSPASPMHQGKLKTWPDCSCWLTGF